MKTFLIKSINFYQKNLSLDQGVLNRWSLVKKKVCVFYPTCSEYSKLAIEKHGALKGIKLTFFRILRCHPWQKEHIDPV